LSLDGIHLELSDQGLSCYDGIASVSVLSNSVQVDLNERGTGALRDTAIEICHNLPPERISQMRQVIGIILDGYAHYADCG